MTEDDNVEQPGDEQESIKVGASSPDDGAAPGGIRIGRSQPPDVKPPMEGFAEEPEPTFDAEGSLGVMATGRIPLDPLTVTPMLRFEGILLAEMTKYKGWLYTEEEITAIGHLIEQCGISAKPEVQLILCVLGLHMVKGGGWIMWKKTGQPEAMRMGMEEAPGESQ